MKEAKGLSTNWLFQNGNADIKYSSGNVVSNIVIAVCSARWVLQILWEHFVKYIIVYIYLHAASIQNNTESKL